MVIIWYLTLEFKAKHNKQIIELIYLLWSFQNNYTWSLFPVGNFDSALSKELTHGQSALKTPRQVTYPVQYTSG